MKSLKRLGAGSALACLALCGLAAPTLAKTLAVLCPIPLAPPVIKATLPSSLMPYPPLVGSPAAAADTASTMP